jgi:hypothetical protein
LLESDAPALPLLLCLLLLMACIRDA